MNDNIVQFGGVKVVEDPRIWVCGHCGCENFWVYEDGTTECSLCHFKDVEQRGGWAEKASPDPGFDDSNARRTNTPHGAADFAKAAIMKFAKEDSCVIVVLRADGWMKAWSDLNESSTGAQKDWLRRSLAAGAALILGEPTLPSDPKPK